MLSPNCSGVIRSQRMLMASVDSSHSFSNSSFEWASRSSLRGVVSPFTISVRPGTAMASSSFASSENGRMPPTENSKSSFSGKASITRRVSRRLPCHISRRPVDEITSLMIVFVLFMIQSYPESLTRVCQQIFKKQEGLSVNLDHHTF
ncbi:hypothetical protein FQZ97_925070 [compost metagenome]